MLVSIFSIIDFKFLKIIEIVKIKFKFQMMQKSQKIVNQAHPIYKSCLYPKSEALTVMGTHILIQDSDLVSSLNL